MRRASGSPRSSIKAPAGFDFSFQSSLDKNRIMALAALEFIDRSEVVHFLGPPGTGKSHLSLALGVQAIKAGRSVQQGRASIRADTWRLVRLHGYGKGGLSAQQLRQTKNYRPHSSSASRATAGASGFLTFSQ